MSDTTPPSFDGVFDESLFAAEDAAPASPDPASIHQMLAENPASQIGIGGHFNSEGRQPRFDGDTSELPPEACWALQELMGEPHVMETKSKKNWAAMLRYEGQIRSRLSELGQTLEINRELGFAFTDQADDPSPRSRKLQRVQTLSLTASALVLHLYGEYMFAPDNAVVETADLVDHMRSYKPARVTDGASFDKKTYNAIDTLRKVGIIKPIVGTDRFIIYSVITSVLSAERVEILKARFNALFGESPTMVGNEAKRDVETGSGASTDEDGGDLEVGDE